MRARIFRWLVVLGVLAALVVVGIVRYRPLDPVGDGREITSTLTLVENGREIERLTADHDPGATFTVAQPFRNLQNLPITITGATMRDRIGQSLFVLDEVRYLPGLPDLDVVEPTGDVLESVDLSGGESLTLLLSFRHVEPCVDWAPSIGDARSTVDVTYELFGLERRDSIALERPIEVFVGPDGWTSDEPCRPGTAAA